MSILIQGMEMPKGNNAVSITIFPNGKVSLANDYRFAKCAEAVPIPPHGRLIEKNAVFELIRSFPNVDRQLPEEFMKALYELSTVIPADPPKEET